MSDDLFLKRLVKQPAVFSDDRAYRYSLHRAASRFEWAPDPPALFILLNPSTADETTDDPTIRRCRGFAAAWGLGDVYITNLFAIRATNPKVMLQHSCPVSAGGGEHNDLAIIGLAGHVHRSGGLVVCAWGAHGTHQNRGQHVRRWFAGPELRGIALHHMGLTNGGQPRHPLYLRGDTLPEPWEKPA